MIFIVTCAAFGYLVGGASWCAGMAFVSGMATCTVAVIIA